MARPKVKMNPAGARALLRSPEVRDFLEAQAKRMAAEAGPGYEARSEVGPNRARAQVETVSENAEKDNAQNNTLLRVLK